MSGPPHRSVCAVGAGAEPASRAPRRGASSAETSTTRGTGAPLPTASTPRPHEGATHGTHTPPRRGPEGDTGLRETTPPLGLRHLRDDLERSRGTTDGRTRHAHTPTRGAQRGGSGTALPTAGRAARGAHAEKAQREQSAVSADPRPPTTPRGRGQETEDQGQRPHPTPLPSSPTLTGRGRRQARGPVDRPRRADAFSGNAHPSSGTA